MIYGKFRNKYQNFAIYLNNQILLAYPISCQRKGLLQQNVLILKLIELSSLNITDFDA